MFGLDVVYLYEFALFAVMGAGANFVLPTALAQQIPYLQDHTPEGLCIATYMNISTACSIVPTLIYLILKNRGVIDIPFETSVPTLLTVGFLTSFLSAAVYSIVVWKISLLLFICCTISGAVGSLSAVIFNPYITRFKNNYISATRVGGSGGQLLAAVVAAIQQPGSSKETISTSSYLVIFGVLLMFPLLAYHLIRRSGVGLKGKSDGAGGAGSKGDEEEGKRLKNAATIALTPVGSNVNTSTSTANPMVAGSDGDVDDASTSSRRQHSAEGDSVEHMPLYFWKSTTALSHWWHEAVIDGVIVRFLDRHTTLVRDNKDWLPRVIPLMLTISWVNFNTWGMLSALMPFAVHFATMPSDPVSETVQLSIAYQVAALCLVLGDYSTTMVKLPIDLCLVVFTVLVVIIYVCASDIAPGSFQTPGTSGFIVAIYCLSRLLEAHMVTSLYRCVATEIAPRDRENAAQAVGTSDQVSTVSGAILSTILVSTISSCSS